MTTSVGTPSSRRSRPTPSDRNGASRGGLTSLINPERVGTWQGAASGTPRCDRCGRFVKRGAARTCPQCEPRVGRQGPSIAYTIVGEADGPVRPATAGRPAAAAGPGARAAATHRLSQADRKKLMDLARSDFVIARPSQLYPTTSTGSMASPEPSARVRRMRDAARHARSSALAPWRRAAGAMGRAVVLVLGLAIAVRTGAARFLAAMAALLRHSGAAVAGLMTSIHRLGADAATWIAERRAGDEAGDEDGSWPTRRPAAERIAAAMPDRLAGPVRRAADYAGHVIVLLAVPVLVGIAFLMMASSQR